MHLIKNKHYGSIIFGWTLLGVASVVFLMASSANAQPFQYAPMERIPGFEAETQGADLVGWITSLYKLSMWIVGICALFMITIGGFTYMTSAGNTSTAGTGKKIITDAVIGLILALVAVLLFTVINPNLTTVNLQITPVSTSTAPATPAGTVAPGATPAPATPTLAPGGTGGLASNPKNLVCIYPPNSQTDQTKLNLCSAQVRPGGCGSSLCKQYVPAIEKYASGVATVKLLKTFMVIESDCDIKAGTGTSYGLMQITPGDVSDAMKNQCGLSGQAITSSWLTSPQNAEASICLAAEIIKDKSITCGTAPTSIYAGYNAGAGNCSPSVDCATDQSCSGGMMKKWECPFDNNKTDCNVGGASGVGMQQTRQGATYINYCMDRLPF